MATIDLTPAVLNYKGVRRGDDFADTVTIMEGTPAAAVDVSARTYTAQLRRSEDDTEAIDMVIDMTDAASGVVAYSIAAAVTADMDGEYVWDFQQASPSIRTLMGGTFELDPDVTRAG